jgi:kinesin family protein 2/24
MNLNDAVPTIEDLKTEYGADTDKLCAEHEKLIEQILEEEEEVITGHRRHIDEVVDLVKQEMQLLNEVDKPGSDVEQYVASLDQLLKQKIAMITEMRKQLITFHTHLKTEEAMSKLYQEQQQQQQQEM